MLFKNLSNWHESIYKVETKIKNIPLDYDVVLWGGGAHTEFLYQKTSLFHVVDRDFLIVDSDPIKHGKTWRGIDIESPSVISDIDFTSCCLVLSTYGSQNDLFELARNLGVCLDKIVCLYDEVISY